HERLSAVPTLQQERPPLTNLRQPPPQLLHLVRRHHRRHRLQNPTNLRNFVGIRPRHPLLPRQLPPPIQPQLGQLTLIRRPSRLNRSPLKVRKPQLMPLSPHGAQPTAPHFLRRTAHTGRRRASARPPHHRPGVDQEGERRRHGV